MVVFFHAAGNLAKEKYFGVLAAPFEKLFWFGGEAGVAFFFVLSGFIIHQIHAKEFDQPRLFPLYLRKRAVRVYPTYFIVFVGVYLIARLVPALRDTVPTDAYLLLKSLLLLPQDMNVVGGTGAPVIIVAWSLQYEMFFYATFATALISRWIFYVIGLLLLLVCALQPWLGPYVFPLSFVSSHLIVLFALGMLTSKVVASKLEVKHLGVLIVFSVIAFFTVGYLVSEARDYYVKTISDLSYGVVSALLVFGLARYEVQHKVSYLVKKVAVLGDASYVLYLIHFPLIAILSKVCMAVLPLNAWGVYAALFVLVAGSIAASLAFHLVVEKPLLKLFRPK